MRACQLTLELLASLLQRHLVSQDDIARVQAHRQEVLGPLQQLASEDKDKVGSVTHLLVSLEAGHRASCTR